MTALAALKAACVSLASDTRYAKKTRALAATLSAYAADPVFAQVSQRGGSGIDPWDGSPLPFNTVDTDADALWDATNFRFVATVEGWYDVRATVRGQNNAPVPSSGRIDAVVYGPGDNVDGDFSGPAPSQFFSLSGYTHLRVGDGIDFQGDLGPDGGAVLFAVFSIELVKAT